MIIKLYLFLSVLWYYSVPSNCITSESLQLSSLRYNECGRYECAETGKYQFRSDYQYRYNYTLIINSTFDRREEKSELILKFKVHILIKSCEGVMKVERLESKRGFAVFDEDETDKIYHDISEKNLRFSFYDGSIINVCPLEGETISSLNIKKGILSAFQNKMKRFDIDKITTEKDINGICPTQYTLERVNGTTLVIRKTKDISNCMERYQLHSIIPTSKYVFQSKFNKWAPLNSTLVCHQTIDHNIPIDITCSEDHTMKLTNMTYNSRTRIFQRLELIGEVSNLFNFFDGLMLPDEFISREDLSFNHKKPKKSEISELEESEGLLSQLCNITSQEFQPNAASTFTKFIHTARHLSYDALQILLERAPDICSTGKEHVQDSLPFLRSTAAVALMTDIMINGNVPESTSNGWLFAMSLFSRPDEEVIQSVTPLLQSEDASINMLLSISSVVHSYCRWIPDCHQEEIINATITYMEINLNKTITDGQDWDKIIVLLKSLGNAGVRTETIKYTLSNCISNYYLPIDIRIAAIESHRRLSCDFNLEFLLKIFTDVDAESEIRISAYLQVMRCPSYSAIKIVKNTLENEDVNQVGTFVWSHIQNMMKSSHTYRIEVQSILQDYYLQKKFRTDFRKYSRNYERSFFFNDYGIGGIIMGNVIFSTKSYIPRYLSLNVTLNAYGESINVLEGTIFLQGFEKLAEKFFKDGAEHIINQFEKKFPSLRFLRGLPQTLHERILALPNNIIGNFPDPMVSFSFKLFGNEIKYVSYRNKDEINNIFENFDIYSTIKEFLNGKQIKYDYSTVFMDISYVSPTGAGVPLNLDAVGIAITNFDTAVFVDASNFTDLHKIFIDGKLKPRFSVNFEGTMGTDLVYQQTQVQLKSKLYTTSEVEGTMVMDGYDNFNITMKLPLKKFDIFSLESDLYYRNNSEQKDVILKETAMSPGTPVCFWPLLDQALGLKVCSTYNIPDSTQMLLSLLNMIKGPFKFSLYVEKSDPTAKEYVLRYNRKNVKVNESSVILEFETPNSASPRDMKMLMHVSPVNSNITITIHSNNTLVQAQGVYKYTANDKVLNFYLDINGQKHIDLILELHMRQEKRDSIYTPKLYLAISSKPVAELSGTYKWTEKTGISQCTIDLKFKTNKFDSIINGSITLNEVSTRANIHILYKFEKNNTENLNFEFYHLDTTTKMSNVLKTELKLESSFYPEINCAINLTYQKSHDRIDAKIDFLSNPFVVDDKQKLKVQFVFGYFKTFNGLKLNSHLEIVKVITDVNVKFGISHQSHSGGSKTIGLIRYAKNKDIVVRLEIYSPQSPRFQYEIKLNTTLPSVTQPMLIEARIYEKFEKEYYIDFFGAWFSGHTARADGLFHDTSTHYMNNYYIKLIVRSRLFTEVVLNTRLTSYPDSEHKVTIDVDHNNIKYEVLARHLTANEDLYEMYIEYIYNRAATYYLNSKLDLKKKEVFAELHLDSIRDIHLAAKGSLKKWNSNVGIEFKWDVNRDPSQKLMANFHTKSILLPDDSQYIAKFLFEYPGHVSVASLLFQHKESYYSFSASLEMNQPSIIEIMAYFQNELFTRGIAQVGFKLLTPFENWKESALSLGCYTGKQHFQTNGSLVWQGDQNIIFDSQGGYKFDDNTTSISLSSVLNSTLQDLSALAFNINYTSITDLVHLSFLLQPNLKYSLQVSTTGNIKYYENATEYIFVVATRTPFLEYVETELNYRLKLMTENRINSDINLRLDNKTYTLYLKGILNPFEKTKLCLHLITPIEKYKDVNGIIFYDPEEKNIFINVTSLHFQVETNVIYIYNNLTNFHLRLQVATPLSYMSKLILVAMYTGKELDLRCGWNSFILGFASKTHFSTWNDLEYKIELYTPIESFRESKAVFKSFKGNGQIIFKGRVVLSNGTKAGINLEYNSEKDKVAYLDECDNYYDKDTPGIYKSTVLSNLIFELDTLIYPTIMGEYNLRQTDNRYTLECKAAIFYLKANLWNQLDFESKSSFNNTFNFFSTIDMLSNLKTRIKVKNYKETLTKATMDLNLITFNQTFKTGVDINHEFHPSIEENFLRSNKNKNIGVHDVILYFYTPFELLEKGKIIVTTEIQHYNITTNVNLLTNYTNIAIFGNLEKYENFFDLNAAFNMSSIYITIPSYHIKILRDFSKLQKEINFSLKEPLPNNTYFHDIFSMRSMWYIEQKNRISLSGELKSPFRILDELKASLHYAHQSDSEIHDLEAFMKYSNKTEMKARARLTPPNVTLNLESSMEGLRQAHFEGSLERSGAGEQKIDAVMITNPNFKIQGSSSVTDMMPFSIKGKLFKGKEGVELSSVEMYVKKKDGGYNVLAVLNSKGKTLNVETEITDFPNNTRIINLQIITTKGEIERLQINAELKLQHPGIYILTVKGDTVVEDTKGSFISRVEIWFRNSIGAIFASLDSALISGKSEIFTAINLPHEVYSSAKIQYTIQKQTVDLFNSNLYFYQAPKPYTNITSGISIHLNKKWIMEANLTTIINSLNDSKVTTNLLLPNKDAYSFIFNLKYNEKFDEIQHLVMYARPKDTPCFTLSDINVAKEDVYGFFAFKCGIKDTLFMIDDFKGKKSLNKLNIKNLLRSNTLANSLITDVNYSKPSKYHIIGLKFYYPPTRLIARSETNFESTNNFNCLVNTTTPFPTIPYFACEINAKTEPSFYQRYGKIYLHNKPALFNITHVKTNKSNSILNNGQIQVVFPVATWHEGILAYKYEDKFIHIKGSAELLYNNDRIITSNFTKDLTKTPTQDKEFTNIAIGNNFVPIGINYYHDTSIPEVTSLIQDFKRTEIFKLKNPSFFNLTGEALVETSNEEEWTTVKLLNFNRSVVIKSYKNGADLHENGIYIRLKPEFWFNYRLHTNKIVTSTTYSKLFDMNIAYPRRNFSLAGEFGYGTNYITSQFTVYNFMTTPRKAIGLILNTNKSPNGVRETKTTLFHPSFQKNVTLYTTFSHSKTILADIYADLEYSLNPNRKLILTGIIEDKSIKGNRNYIMHITGKHPVTKFNLDVSGALQTEIGNHFIGNNISYTRSYLPEHFWIGKAILNTNNNMVEVERISLRGKILFHSDYEVIDTKHLLNTIIIEGTGTHISGAFELDLKNKKTHSLINLTSDASDRLQIEGNMPENREAKFNIWRTYNDFNFPQMSFYLTLNHSRFLSSALLWRTDIGYNILGLVRKSVAYVWNSAQESIEFWTQFLRSEATDTITDVWHDAKPDMREFLDDFNNMKTIQDNINHFKSILNDSYNANEFFLKDIHQMYTLLTQEVSIMEKLGSLPKIISEVWESMGETGEVIRKSLIWMVNTIKELYEELMHILDQLVEGKAEVYVSKFIKKATEKFDNFVKDLHISFIASTESVITELVTVLDNYWAKILAIFEPTFIEIIHHIDSTFWSSVRKLIDFIYARKDELMSSPYFLRSANFTQKLDSIYKDLTKNDFITNFKKYVGVIFDAVYEYYFSQIPFREELKTIGNEIIGEIKELYNLPLIAYTVDNINMMYNQVMIIYNYFDVTTGIQKLIPFFYRQWYENSFTALEVEMKNHKPKTKFIFDPESGIIKLEQKLPFPWHAFNETPVYEEIEEYKFIKKVQSYFTISKFKFWSVFNTAISLLDPEAWFPPFKGHATLVGLNNFITFDSRHVPFYGNSCQYLLSHDFIDDEFSLVLNSYSEHSSTYESISLLTEGEIITITFSPPSIKLDSRATMKFPFQLNQTFIYYDQSIITIKNQRGITLQCNMYYNICTVHLSGWFFGKVSGLLGTMNNEPSDDITLYNKHQSNPQWYLWSLSYDTKSCPATNSSTLSLPDNGVNERCKPLFSNTSSVFEPCFNEVNPQPFYDICITNIETEMVCSVAMAYVQSCKMNSIPLRIPDYCVKCELSEKKMAEGQFIQLQNNSVSNSGDIVFIVEAKACNSDMFLKKNITNLISTFNKETSLSGYTKLKYSLVVFGGNGVYDNPHSVVINNNIFTDAAIFPKYFENIPTGNGSSDIFAAIRFASKLPFRSSVSKTLILLACSNCDPGNMLLDYSVLHHALSEKAITLHILLDDHLPGDKANSGKTLFGVDGYTAFTKNDFKNLRGDPNLRHQIKLTKSMLGYCTPLALESNGTLFTAKYLSDNNMAKKFVTVFSKRIIKTMKPNSCQNCECHSDGNGVPYTECIPCVYPTPISFDFSLDTEDGKEISFDSQSLPTSDDSML